MQRITFILLTSTIIIPKRNAVGDADTLSVEDDNTQQPHVQKSTVTQCRCYDYHCCCCNIENFTRGKRRKIKQERGQVPLFVTLCYYFSTLCAQCVNPLQCNVLLNCCWLLLLLLKMWGSWLRSTTCSKIASSQARAHTRSFLTRSPHSLDVILHGKTWCNRHMNSQCYIFLGEFYVKRGFSPRILTHGACAVDTVLCLKKMSRNERIRHEIFPK